MEPKLPIPFPSFFTSLFPTLFLCLLVLGTACASSNVSPTPGPSHPVHTHVERWRYEAVINEQTLGVIARFPPNTKLPLTLPARARPFLRALRYAHGNEWRSLEKPEDLQSCASGCQLSYLFELERALPALEGLLGTEQVERVSVVSIAAWLLRPARAPPSMRYRLSVDTKNSGKRFHSGLVEIAPNTYEGPAAMLGFPPYAVLGDVQLHKVRGLRVALPKDAFSVPDQRIIQWIDRRLGAIFDYYGTPTINDALIIILPCAHRGIHGGAAMGYGGASLKVHVSKRITEAQLLDEWTLTHELVHLGFPNVGRQNGWLEEGVAVYVEPLARARAGLMSPARFWSEFMDGAKNALQRGTLRFGGRLSWGAMYWGGALFYLLAEVELQRRTNGQCTVACALRAVTQAGGNIRVTWSLDHLFSVSDAPLGAPVLSELAAKVRGPGLSVDLAALWQKLGIERSQGKIRFVDAPWSHIRKRMFAPQDFSRR